MAIEIFDSEPGLADGRAIEASRASVLDGWHIEVTNDQKNWLVLGTDADVSNWIWFRVVKDE